MAVSLDDATDPNLHGRKAATLARLKAAGFPVPEGTVVPVGSDGFGVPLPAGMRFAVRSSAADEDGAHESAAGRYVSLLDIDASGIDRAVAAVRESAGGRPMAVLVMPMIQPAAAGAAFSVNPVTGDDETVVSAVPGLADRLMEGSTTGSEWVVRGGRVGLVSGTEEMMSVVSDVADLASRVADHLGHPVDIEWAVDEAGLHLLQARPITALPRRPDLDLPQGNWMKDATHHAAPLTPLVASMVSIDGDATAAWAERVGLMIAGLDQVTVGGELYVRPVPVIGSPDATGSPPWWAVALLARVHPAVRRRMRAAEEFVRSELFRDPRRVWEEELKPEAIDRIATLRGVDPTQLDDGGLLAHVADIEDFARWASAVHFDLFVPYVVAMHDFAACCERLLGMDASAAMTLLAGASPASSAPTRAMSEVAELVKGSPAARDALGSDGFDILTQLRSADAAVGDAMDTWVEEHAFRVMNYDWSSPTLAEQPSTIIAMLRAEVESPSRVLDADETVDRARRRLSGSGLAEFDRALERALEVSPVREDNVTPTTLVPGALRRRAYLEIGRRLVERGRLRLTEQVFQLRRDEAHGALDDDRSWTETADRREAERRWVLAHPGPMVLGEAPSPPPDLRGLPEAGRTVNSALMWGMEAEFAPLPEPTGDDAVRGLPGAPGSHTGTARIVRTETDFGRVRPGDVVICPITNPSWSVLFGIAGGFVCDAGGPLSHTAILTREYAIPSVLATGDASRRIPDGSTVTVDGTAGTVSLRSNPSRY